ncbi:MAG: hypothetical protein HDT18_05750 [Oscillibacter sp.]|nr:hypothetical protein [Oscillibacter sp.]
MLTVKEAAQIGINACIDKIGRDFVLANRDNGVSGYGENDGMVFCYVGVDDKPWVDEEPDVLVLDSTSKFPYRVSCNVRLADGTTDFIECVLPA